MKRVFSRSIGMSALLTVAIGVPSGFCFAWCGPNGNYFDAHTRYMWSRTWNAQNSLAMPLNAYYVPRSPGYCGSSSRGAGGDCRIGVAAGFGGQYGASPYAADAMTGFEPVQFERLGQVANELDIIGNVGNTGRPPAAQTAPAAR